MSAHSVVGSVVVVALWLAIGLVILVVRARPFRALGVLVAGMAVHNLLLMVLVAAEVPPVLIRSVQAWKEIILGVLVLVVIGEVIRRDRRTLPKLVAVDWIVIAYAVLVVGHLVIQLALSLGEATLAQRLVSLRLSLLLPLLYALGRLLLPGCLADVRFTNRALMLSAVVVAGFGLWELWFVPTRLWIEWGSVSFAQWLGYDYGGPGGLAANYFQSLGPGIALRRMVSTYISPLGIAYTGLLMAPLAATWLLHRSRFFPRAILWVGFVLIVSAMALSVTRLALIGLVIQFVILSILYRNVVSSLLAGITVVAVVLAVFAYPAVGPRLARDLSEHPSVTREWREPIAGSGQPSGSPTPSPSPLEPSDTLVDRAISGEDPSIRAHINAITHGVAYVVKHPLGTGLGSAIPRYGDGQMEGPSESALLRIGGETGIAGAALYILMYGGSLLAAWLAVRRHATGWPRQFAVVTLIGGIGLFPIMLTSDVWGNFSVTFMFWWAAGLSVSAAYIAEETSLPETESERGVVERSQ